jgi:hypothetical protein
MKASAQMKKYDGRNFTKKNNKISVQSCDPES